MKKKVFLSLVLVFSLVLSVLQGFPGTRFDFSSKSMATSKSANDAINWVKSQVGKSLDTDGYPSEQPYQCVDLIKLYYQFLGATSPGGNGADYASNALPAGWNRYKGVQPEKGDILVYTGGYKGYGHVGIYETNYSHYHQNVDGHTSVVNITRYAFNGFHDTTYWGVIRPNWNGGNNPQGCIDLVSGGDGTITVAGWAFDRDNPNASIEVHVYVGGDAASGEGHIVYANQYREDVNSAYSIGGNHGFSDTWTVSKRGTQSVYFYLINIGGGGNVLMDPHTVTINNPAPVATAAPVVTPVPTKTPVPVVTPAPTVKPTIIASPTVRPSSVPVATFTPVSTSIPISTIEPGSGTESSEKVAPNPPSFKLKGIKKGFKVTITKEAGNSWYDIEYSTKSSMRSARTTTIFQDGGSTKKVTWLKRKKKYYVRVRSYNGLNGPWSYIRIVRTK